MEQNPNTPVTDTAPTQAQFNTPIQPKSNPKTKGALSKLLSALSLTEDQYQFKTPKNNPKELVEQEQTDFSVPTQNIEHKNPESPKFIHKAQFEEDMTDNIYPFQLDTYTKENPTHIEGKLHIGLIQTWLLQR